VVLLPEHIVVGLPLAVTVGFGFTIKLIVRVLVQIPLAPVIVYVVVTVGLTATLAPVSAPGFQVYEVAPFAVKVAELPTHIAVGFDTTVNVGVGVT
jgi:hypothetical protein